MAPRPITRNTVPIALVASIAAGLQFLPADSENAANRDADRETRSDEATGLEGSSSTAPAEKPTARAPEHYTVVAGDTVSGIAARYGLTTSSVLALNGLSRKSIIYPGQVLRLTAEQAASPQPAPPTSPKSDARYVVVAGDTVSGIAAKYGVSVQALLDANGLTRSSIIYPGQTFVIPSKTSKPKSDSDSPDSTATALSAEMAANARIIVSVGRSLGVSDDGIVIALAAAAQESSLINRDDGDRDSVGLFQQRPSQGWGTAAQILDPHYAATAFFTGVEGKTLGLLDISGWTSMSVTEAAQAVQISDHPGAYAKWEASARSWLSQLG